MKKGLSPAVQRFFRENRRYVVELGIASLLINLFALALPLYSMLVYNKAVGNQMHDTLWALAIGVLIVISFDLGLRVLRVMMVEFAGSRWDIHLDDRLARGILAAPLSKSLRIGDLLAKYRQMTDSREVLSAGFLMALADIPFAILFLAVIAWIGGPLVCVPLGVGGMLFVTGRWFQSVSRQRHHRANEATADKMTALTDMLLARDGLMQRQAALAAETAFRSPCLASARQTAAARLWSQIGMQTVSALTPLSTVLMLLVGVYRIEDQLLTVGGLISCNMLNMRLVGTLGSIPSLLSKYKEFTRATTALHETVDFSAASLSTIEVTTPAIKEEGMRLEQVSFAYPGRDASALQPISLRLPYGELVVLVGASGAGKTTLLRVLAGQMAQKAGKLLFAGRHMETDEDRRWLASQIAYKPQDPSFLKGSVADVVRGGGSLSDSDILSHLAAAGLRPALDQGTLTLNTQVGLNGAGLSGGQKQMLALARALASGAEVLILDEPTAGLDRAAQLQIQTTLAGLACQRLVLVSTHDADVIGLANRVLVLDQGKLVADAPPSKLLGKTTESSLKPEMISA